MTAVFLSASVPVAGRAGYETADPYLIREAVTALVEVILGRRLLVWGGHPAITPMIWAASEALNLDYKKCVRLYQSNFFEDRYPQDNERFQNVVYVERIGGDREKSLRQLRHTMFTSHDFQAAVFIGGMEGVMDELNLFRELQPRATLVPVPGPGGVAREIFATRESRHKADLRSIDFSSFLYDRLEIDPREERRALTF